MVSEARESVGLEVEIQAATADVPKFSRGEDQGRDGMGMKLVKV